MPGTALAVFQLGNELVLQALTQFQLVKTSPDPSKDWFKTTLKYEDVG